MDERTVIELIKYFDDINFSEQKNGESTIGYIQDHGRTIYVDFLEDNLGQYLKLSHSMNLFGDAQTLKSKLSLWFKHGRYTISEQTVVLYQIFPILDEKFLHKQIKHTMCEIWDMSATAKLN